MRNQLLRDGDVMSMAFGLELRTPFLDAGLVETRVPDSGARAPGRRAKGLLLQAVPDVPDGIA